MVAAQTAGGRAPSPPAALATALRERRGEIEEAIISRVYAISDPAEVTDPSYVEGLRAALAAAIEFGVATVECGEGHVPPMPAVLRDQAGIAARNGVDLATVLRRYFAGYSLLGDFIIAEQAEVEPRLARPELRRILRRQALLFDELLSAVSEEYAREAGSRFAGSEQRRADHVKKLLAGELVDAADFRYEISGRWHLGIIGVGLGASAVIRGLAARLDCRLLSVCPGDGKVWAWLGSPDEIDAEAAARRAASKLAGEGTLVMGENAHGLSGWRLTHRQALAALPIGLRGARRVTRYAEVPLLAAALRDETLTSSLLSIYVAPLEAEKDGGAAFLETLRAYYKSRRQVAATAAALGVSRQTVNSRLRSIEERIGQSVDANAAEAQTALDLWQLSTGQSV